ncbi:MAG: 6-pyruvoyl-tetrahydropterin synthase-related protein, partial [Verrucomicrobia bacterium]|nr:6-pyruvoyl-tetrahydropterin synthase-related protein [Verrucomicrobiota bacterium]
MKRPQQTDLATVPHPAGADPLHHRIEWFVGLLLTGLAVILAYHMLQPTVAKGSLLAGDDAIHSALSIEAAHLLRDNGRFFDWSYMYGLGAPIFIFRPPGFHVIVQLLHAATLRTIPLETVHKFGYVLALMLYPTAVFYFLRKFHFRPLVAGLGALLALAPISTWGHTIDAYYDLGLAKQAFAIMLFPFVFGKFHGIVAHRDKRWPGAFLFGLMFLNHPYMGMSFCMLGAVYLLIEALADWHWRNLCRLTTIFLGMIVTGLLLIAFWMVPFYTSPEIHPTENYSSTRRHGFAVRVETVAATTEHLLKGSLFDHAPTSRDRFGGDTIWAWRDTSANPRWPVLSWFAILGAAGCMFRFRSRKNIFLLSAWLASLIIFMGPDDIPLLRLVPFQSQFQYSHFVFAPELFTICLAAVGLAMLVGIVWKPVSLGLKRLRCDGIEVTAAFILVAMACTAPFIVNVQKERHAHIRPKSRNRQFEAGLNGQTAWSLKNPANVSFQQATAFIQERLSRFERFYGSPTNIHAGKEIFHFTLAPSYMSRGNL